MSKVEKEAIYLGHTSFNGIPRNQPSREQDCVKGYRRALPTDNYFP
ncbi:rCG40918 [Rattus norvegicus]|uniref:RCG40918 n=1 Tax=Rattus norvegicus TaxID=10116 RepID=A6KL25_RAT|nr:rCG40918 [Rattus norvegicus]